MTVREWIMKQAAQEAETMLDIIRDISVAKDTNARISYKYAAEQASQRLGIYTQMLTTLPVEALDMEMPFVGWGSFTFSQRKEGEE